jgi:flagellar P-ring protein precursor FlgI
MFKQLFEAISERLSRSLTGTGRGVMKPFLISGCVAILLSSTADATTRLKNICRVKGQEENVLRGQGLVVGLNGTGEANDPMTMRAIARAMEIMGNPLAMNGQQTALTELRRMKNVAMVWVEATVPATGARRGDRIDCYVSALNGKSLEGGRLAFAALQGPNTQDRTVYALCQGQLSIDNPEHPTVAVVHGGCQMEADLFTPFVNREGYFTLVLDKNHASFLTANDIADAIGSRLGLSTTESASIQGGGMVRAIDASNIIVRIPEADAQDPVALVALILETPIGEPEPEARVTINQQAGTIVISGDVEIGDVIVSHKNVTVETVPIPAFAAIDADESNKPKLDQLVKQLNALHVSTADMIEIIQGIDRNGKLHGRLIVD